MAKQGESKMMPRLRFPEFRKDSGFRETTVGQISNHVIAGGTPDTTERTYWNGKLRWMNSGELNLKRVHEVQGRITNEGLNNSSTKEIPAHCVLIGLAGQGKTRGTVAMNMIPLSTNQSIAAIYPNEGLYNSDFLYHNLDSRYEELRSLSAGGEGRGGLNLQIIKSLRVYLPSIAEQQKIADCLTSLDEVIAAQGRKVEELKRHKRGLMQQLFPREGETRPRLRFPKFRNAPEWEVSEIGAVCEVLNKRRIPITSGERRAGPYPYYGASGIVDYVDDFIFDERLLLVGEDGAKWGKFETTAFIADGKYWVNNHAHVLKPIAVIDTVLQNYLTMIDLAGYVTGNAPPKLTLAKLKTIPVVFPKSKLEQLRIADCLSALDTQIAAEAKKHAKLKSHKKGLLQQLFPAPEGS